MLIADNMLLQTAAWQLPGRIMGLRGSQQGGMLPELTGNLTTSTAGTVFV